MQASGADVLKLNTGNPAAFGFSLPDSIRSALEGNIDKAVAYCDFQGMPGAREAIARYAVSKGIQGVDTGDVFVGNGVSEVVSFALIPPLNPGDEVLVPMPNYSLWSNTVYLTGGTPVFYRCDEASGWNPDVADLKRKITSKIRALVIINPNNPTGALYSTDVLTETLDVARAHDLPVFSDEIYDRLVMDGQEHISTASLAEGLGVKESYLLAVIRRIPSLRLPDSHTLELCAGPNCGHTAALAACAEKLCKGKNISLKFTLLYAPVRQGTEPQVGRQALSQGRRSSALLPDGREGMICKND